MKKGFKFILLSVLAISFLEAIPLKPVIYDVKLKDYKKDILYSKYKENRIFNNDALLNTKKSVYVAEILGKKNIEKEYIDFTSKAMKNFLTKYFDNLELKKDLLEPTVGEEYIDKDYIYSDVATYKIKIKLNSIYVGRKVKKNVITYESSVFANVDIYDMKEGTRVIHKEISGYSEEEIPGKWINKYTTLVIERSIKNMLIHNLSLFRNTLPKVGTIDSKWFQKGKEYYLLKINYDKALAEVRQGLKVNIYRNVFIGDKNLMEYKKMKLGEGIVTDLINQDSLYILVPNDLKILQEDYINVQY